MITEPGAFGEFDFSNLPDRQLLAVAGELGQVAARRGMASAAGNTMMRAAESLYLYGEVKTGLGAQLGTAFIAYGQVIEGLNAVRDPEDRVGAASEAQVTGWFEAQLVEWETNGGLAYVRQQLETKPHITFTLVAQPNIEIGSEELWELVHKFGTGQPVHAAHEDPKLYDSYSPAELSGLKPTAQAVRFLLVPSDGDRAGTPLGEELILEDVQREHPYLYAPAPAIAPAYWRTLRAKGDLPATADATAYGYPHEDLTSLHHFEMTPRRAGRQAWARQPRTYINEYGGPRLDAAFASGNNHRNNNGIRLVVG